MKETVYLKVAGFIIGLEFGETEHLSLRKFVIKTVCSMCKGFVIADNPSKIDFYLHFTDTKKVDIAYKNNKAYFCYYEELASNRFITYYYLSPAQLNFIVWYIIGRLLINYGFILHASAALIRGNANIFLGKSGAGKSTIIGLLKDKYQSLANDVVIIKKESDSFYFYQAPFYAKDGRILKSVERYPIGNMFFLKQSNYQAVKCLKDKTITLKKLSGLVYSENTYSEKQTNLIIDFVFQSDNFKYLYFNNSKRKIHSLFDFV